MGIKKKDYQPLDCPHYTVTQKPTTRVVLCTFFIVQLLLIILWVFTLIEKSKNWQTASDLEERKYQKSNVYPVLLEANIFEENHILNYQSGFEDVDAKNENEMCVKIPPDERLDCFPEKGAANEESCLKRVCCWDEIDEYGVPSCYYPRNYSGYQFLNESHKHFRKVAYLSRTFPSPYEGDVKFVRIEAKYFSKDIMHIKMFDPLNRRYEPPLPEIPVVSRGGKKAPCDVKITKAGMEVVRRDGSLLMRSEKFRGFIFANQFLQLSLEFKGKIYGLGEHQTSLQLDTNWTKLTFFAQDGIPEAGENLYGSHPFYMVLDPKGSCHGVFLHNSNAMDVILQPSPAITFRSIGGIFSFYIFLGPTPADVIRQFTDVVGRPFLPPYWSLGFHLSRLGYKNTLQIREVWERTRAAGIPFDVQWHDIDYMERNNDFTYDGEEYSQLPDFVEEVHQAGMHYVPIIDPGISGCEPKGTYPPFDQGVTMDVFVKFSNGSLLVGKVWNRKCTVFPDFTAAQTKIWWRDQIKNFHKNISFDGIWIDMNEPTNFVNGTSNGCPQNSIENPPYLPNVRGEKLYSSTICMSAIHSAGLHYDLHNLYGFSEAIATYRALEALGKRPFIISRSTFPGSGKYAGHWSGDVESTWEAMSETIPKMLTFSLFGIPMMGADICGFNGNTTAALCQRWSQLGAFYPFSRNHNSDDCIDQDPVALGENVVMSAKKALMVRYSLLPYLYTLFYKAHTAGETVARPLFVEFWKDQLTHDIDDSFLWGCCILIAPVLEPNTTTLKLYLPEGRWYNWYTRLGLDSEGVHVTVNAPPDTIPLFIRGGAVIPTQAPAGNTWLSRKNNIDLIAAFSTHLNGSGMLYWDDGETLDSYHHGKYGRVVYKLNAKELTGVVEFWRGTKSPTMGTVTILGFWKPVQSVIFNRKEKEFHWNSTSLVLTVKVNQEMKVPFVMQWK